MVCPDGTCQGGVCVAAGIDAGPAGPDAANPAGPDAANPPAGPDAASPPAGPDAGSPPGGPDAAVPPGQDAAIPGHADAHEGARDAGNEQVTDAEPQAADAGQGTATTGCGCSASSTERPLASILGLLLLGLARRRPKAGG
ncbi:MAG: MYXO-CTERM sorting domain-containing protein [Myxococcales bacterium]